MQCPECGNVPSDVQLKYCEECGAKMPTPPPGAVGRPAARGQAAVARGQAAPSPRARLHEVRSEEDSGELEDEAPPKPARPPYHGPKWLEHVPGHSPSVLGVGLMGLAVVLGILPFFASVGPFWSLVVVAGGLLVAARELRARGEPHPLVDWVPASAHPPVVVALFSVVALALAVSMLGVGLTPVLWALGAGLLAHEQYGKLFQGPEGYGRLFEPRQLLKGTRLVALGSVGVCLMALFLTWTGSSGAAEATASSASTQGPPELRVLDVPRAAEEYVSTDFSLYGWDQPLSVFIELLLLGVLGLLMLKPQVERPAWTRFAPLGAAVASLGWGLVHVKLAPGPVVFLAGVLGLGFVGVVSAIPPKAPEPAAEAYEGEGEGEGEYEGGEYADGDPNAGYDGGYQDPHNNGSGGGYSGV